MVFGGDIAKGEGIASETGEGDILMFVLSFRKDTVGVGVPRLPLHTHECAGGVEHVKTTRVFVVKDDVRAGFHANGIDFIIRNRGVDMRGEVVGGVVKVGDQIVGETPPPFA